MQYTKPFALVSLLMFSSPVWTAAQKVAPVMSSLEHGFRQPPDSVKPGVYWYWLNDQVSPQGVVRDLEAMHRIGIGRAFIGNIGLSKEEIPYGNSPLFSDNWWQATEAALRTASQNGMEIGLFNSPGWSQSGGPWVKPAESMRYLTSVEWRVKGPKKISIPLPVEKENFQSVAIMAFPMPAQEEEEIANYQPVVTASIPLSDLQKLVDKSSQTAVIFPDKTKEVQIDLALTKSFTARSIVLYPAATPFHARVILQAGDGNNFTTISEFDLNRSNPQLNVGFIPFAPVSVALRSSTAKVFRLLLTNIRGKAGLAEIKIGAAPVVDLYMEKQLAKMFQTPLPMWNEYQWPGQPEPDGKEGVVDAGKVMDLTRQLSPNGVLHWNVPKGDWIIVRYGMVPTGVTNSPATKEGQGLEVDKMNKAMLPHHFEAFAGAIQQKIAPEHRSALKWLVADSYETGSQNWTDDMIADFKTAMGYDPLRWLPVLSGRIVGSAEMSDRFLWDLRRLIADRVAYHYVGGLRTQANQHGMKLWLENYGHWGFPGEFLQYGGQADEVAGEFWNEGDLGSIENRAASSSAHTYGKTKVSAESFTSAGHTFARYPALLKKRGDWSFTEGVNNTLLHVYIHQPDDEKLPGINAWFGTEFNRHNTWFDQSKAFIDYIRRCNFLLQQGKPVSDIAYFIGEDAPKMTGVRDPEIPPGYQFDYINGEAIARLTVKDGRLVLPDGVSYRLLVLPPLATMRPGVLNKIRELVQAGAVVIGAPPQRAPGLQNYPAADMQVQRTAAELWNGIDGDQVKHGTFGKGMVLRGVSMKEALALVQTGPDFISNTATNVLYAHRSAPGAEIYFITNQTEQAVAFEPAFRVTGLQPEWWDAVTGSMRSLPEYTIEGRHTLVPLKLEPLQSAFIVFRRPAIGKIPGVNFPKLKPLQMHARPWTVQFDTAMKGPAKPVTFTKLEDWSTHSQDAIKHYSGNAIYKTTFSINSLPKGEHVLLNLGVVYNMASLKVNGQELGTVWTAPWQVDITPALKQGENKLEITVVNTWVNRLIGDSRLPEAQRKTWSPVNSYKPGDALQPSGLVGPVTLWGVKY
ncbi:glycosyl hydrolase [Paraflavitalea sp. CAU 1676]|uniref:glycosyl hydrolase n=1 Tax=Paraflavitalea sp. CAU 1676 TaxID=3032598 RepID=UPI0023D9E480|nr:glycosyl hydrolase [Paraflavitalea sp. CAU 1676]MDF2191846.1 glycosyl hydrolase [Paraflavitalea sp. CAU 1676]